MTRCVQRELRREVTFLTLGAEFPKNIDLYIPLVLIAHRLLSPEVKGSIASLFLLTRFDGMTQPDRLP